MLTRLLLQRTRVGARLALPVTRAFHSSPALRAIEMAKVDTTARLSQLRKLMKERNVDIYSRHARAGELEIGS
jgi:Xaa-Pro aminopeptidase